MYFEARVIMTDTWVNITIKKGELLRLAWILLFKGVFEVSEHLLKSTL